MIKKLAVLLLFFLTSCSKQVELSVHSSPHGYVSTAGFVITEGNPVTVKVDVGKIITLVAVPDSGYHLDSWHGLCLGVPSEVCKIEVTSSGDVSVMFSAVEEEPTPEEPEEPTPEEPTPEEPTTPEEPNPEPDPAPEPDPEPTPEEPSSYILPPNPSALYWQLQGRLPSNRNEVVFDIDGFDNSLSVFSSLGNKYVIAYFSAGTWENWRPDANNFPASVRGRNLDDWPGEKWLDIRQLDVLRPIMQNRVAVAKSKGAQAVEWDNLDLFNQNSGFQINQTQTKNYLQMLADITHEAGLAAIFKNTPELSSWAVNIFDGVIVEEAYRYKEVTSYSAWYRSDKPMWAVEYTGTLNCTDAINKGFYLAKFPLDLNGAPSATCPLP